MQSFQSVFDHFDALCFKGLSIFRKDFIIFNIKNMAASTVFRCFLWRILSILSYFEKSSFKYTNQELRSRNFHNMSYSPWNFFCRRKFWVKLRSSHRRCSLKKGALRNLAKFTGKHLCPRLLLNKIAGLRPATLLKKSLWHRCFPVNFAKFLRAPFLQNTSGRLLLKVTFQ